MTHMHCPHHCTPTDDPRWGHRPHPLTDDPKWGHGPRALIHPLAHSTVGATIARSGPEDNTGPPLFNGHISYTFCIAPDCKMMLSLYYVNSYVYNCAGVCYKTTFHFILRCCYEERAQKRYKKSLINPKRKLNTVVYRKPTHTDHYLQFGSHHPLIHKLGVTRTLHYRADTIISDQSDIPSEKDHIEGALKRCGYPNRAFEKAKKQKPDTNQCSTNANPDSELTTKTLITIPYCLGVSERVKNVYKLFGIVTAFKPTNKLLGKLVHVKDKTPRDKQSHLVYGIKCAQQDCPESYVGETKESIKARVDQHRRPSSSDYQPDSAVYTHAKKLGTKLIPKTLSF
ncbi:hypothetical protein BSL78_04397 [Apostichopus japonicus]|uniref:Helix-turn-helix domain-containing protein n=1 Tax=Stichopus japonicus TaxID=307972 RepID=A0A2G8LEM3_STIJA|nr:hypothetical protein BSL78_04397 [Apostichopus japonicus]